MIVPNSEDIIMSQEIFEQNPDLFMKNLVGSITIMRVMAEQADRLERTFDREFLKDIFEKECWTWDDYKLVLDTCI
jgi:hypothetical protein